VGSAPPNRRSIAVTGSASGIGAACATRLSVDGHVIGVDLHDATVQADLGTSDGRQRAIEAIGEESGGELAGLVTCAGLGGWPSRSGALLVSVNYFGTVELLEGLRPLLAQGTLPAAVAISSNSTTIQPEIPEDLVAACLEGDEERARALAEEVGALATYPATKMAIAHWVRRHAPTPQWAGEGIRLNAVAPGMVETPLVAEGRADPESAVMLDMLPIPIGRVGRPEDIAAIVGFLLGPESGYFCGSVVFADGGSDALLRPTDWPSPWRLKLRDAYSEIKSNKSG
jgi:NAD(P)-dependent dehydrogenase (short-subunit alcohol dehydrogenase family)